jgi:hypothetical protein
MPDFNQWIFIGDIARNFNFSKVVTPDGEKYFVTVLEKQNIISSFEMKDKGYGNWIIVQPAPQWITCLQIQLDTIIKNHVLLV